MPELKLTYFDFHGGRGEPARLAMTIGKVPFTDDRFSPGLFPAMKASLPFGAVPVLSVGDVMVSQSNAINRYVGQLAGLYPKDPIQALYCDEILEAAEDISAKIGTTFGIQDKEKMQPLREALVAGPLTTFLKGFDKKLSDRGGEFFSDNRMTVADLAIFCLIKGLKGGSLDFVPTDLTEKIAPVLNRHYKNISHSKDVAAYYQSRSVKLPE